MEVAVVPTGERDRFIRDRGVEKTVSYLVAQEDHVLGFLIIRMGELLTVVQNHQGFTNRRNRMLRILEFEEGGELTRKFAALSTALEEVFRQGADIPNLKGALLELLVLRLEEKKRGNGNATACISCRVIVETPAGHWDSQVPLDAVYWLADAGATYECTVNAAVHNLNVTQLEQLHAFSEGEMRVAIASLRDMGSLLDALTNLGAGSNIQLFSRENLYQILHWE